jgi:general secretion pathway protein A
MYAEFYGLGGRPFDLTPDPSFLLLTPKHREALCLAQYVLSGSTGLALLTGEAGTGKTTVLRAALEDPRRAGDCVITLNNPTLTRDEFFEFLAHGFHLGPQAVGSKTRVLRELTQVLMERHRGGVATALVVDEAQSLSDELLEEIRLLANIETLETKLLSILLAGQPELAERLNEPGLRQLKQRIALRGVLEPLTLAETAGYVEGRLQTVGGDVTRTFTGAAVQAVFAHSGGIPRTVSVICENALITGFALSARPIDHDVVMEVCRDLDLAPAGPALPAVRVGGAPRGGPVLPSVAEAAEADPPRRPAAAAPARAAEPPAKAGPMVEERPAGPAVPAARGPRRMLDRLPFWKRPAGPLRLQTHYFDVDGRAGVVVTPVADERRTAKR